MIIEVHMKLSSAGRMVGNAGGTSDTKRPFPADNDSQVLAITVSGSLHRRACRGDGVQRTKAFKMG